MPFKAELIQHIQTQGPMTVEAFMARAVSHYYATRDPFGTQGDFTTAPEISQIFGELCGAWLADNFIQNGCERALLVEVGPGRGTLMKDILRATKPLPGFHDGIDIVMIETSPALQAVQQILTASHPRISWQNSLDGLPPLPLFLIANEFFDALPIVQQVKTADGWLERSIILKDAALAFAPDGEVIRESSPASVTAMHTISAHIKAHGGAALIIDYGYSESANGDTLQAVKEHSYVGALENPGETDLTAHVDFAALRMAALAEGTQVYGPIEQGLFLKRLGAELRATALCKKATPEQQTQILSGLERLMAPHEMGALFKVLAVTSSLDKPAGF